MLNFKNSSNKKPFVAFPALGYWEIDGKAVSSEKAQWGLNSDAVWKPTEISKNLNDRISHS